MRRGLVRILTWLSREHLLTPKVKQIVMLAVEQGSPRTHDIQLLAQVFRQRLSEALEQRLITVSGEDAPEAVLDYMEDLSSPIPSLEPIVARTSVTAYGYAARVLHAPFPLGEPAISQNASSSLDYARYVLHGPFPLGEPVIAKSPNPALAYARFALHGPFPLGELQIAASEDASLYYAQHILKAPFPAGESAIARSFLASDLYCHNILGITGVHAKEAWRESKLHPTQ